MSISKTTYLLAVVASALLTGAGRAEDLAADVAGKLRDSGALSGYRVHVKSKSGTVWLEGSVADDKQLAAAVGIAESTQGVERVVNRLVIDGSDAGAARPAGLGLPTSAFLAAGVPQPIADTAEEAAPKAPAATNPLAVITGGLMFAGGEAAQANAEGVELVRNQVPQAQPRKAKTQRPMPLGTPTGRPMQAGRAQPVDPRARMAMRTSMQEPMTLPASGGYDYPVQDGQMVPGSMRTVDGGPAGPGGYAGGPMPMGGTGVGMPPVPMRGDGPNMPNYAWPSYAAHPNYASVQYPTQYSPTAWPYIGPFYPYPQVPLGWRRVSLEWDDGWWWLDFDERHYHSHHR
ncbi:MAG: BON domain-containing protein [Pirellulales bacterium]